jgi:MFS family permease
MRQFAFHGKDTYKWWVLVAVSIGNLTVSLDNSILASCLPQLVRVFRTDPIVVGWVNIAYLIASQSFMLTFAKIGDEKGRKLVYLTGMVFYTTGMIICSLSQGVGQLIFARALQGIGAAQPFP